MGIILPSLNARFEYCSVIGKIGSVQATPILRTSTINKPIRIFRFKLQSTYMVQRSLVFDDPF